MFPRLAAFITLSALAVLVAGCSRPQPTADQVAGARPGTPADLRIGRSPAGGPSEAPTGGGAGGSAAAGYEIGRVGSTQEEPTLPPQPAGITYSRMSPVGSSGSGLGDRGEPLSPDVSLAAPPDPAQSPKVPLAPAAAAGTKKTGRPETP